MKKIINNDNLTSRRLLLFLLFVLLIMSGFFGGRVVNAQKLEVNNSNFLDFFTLNGSGNRSTGENYQATYNNPETNAASINNPNKKYLELTQDVQRQSGNASLKYRINLKDEFHLKGYVNLGNKFDTDDGADGIGFALHPNKVGDLGQNGGHLGIGGLANAIGFKLDTYYNPYSESINGYTYPADPFGRSNPFGTFVTTDSKGNLSTAEKTGSILVPGPEPKVVRPLITGLLSQEPLDGKYRRILFDYIYKKDGSGTITVTYSNSLLSLSLPIVWNYTVPASYINANPSVTFVISGSTGGSKNNQKFILDELFTFDAVKKLTIKKKWNDSQNAYNSRPTEISLNVVNKNNPTTVLRTITMVGGSTADEWTQMKDASGNVVPATLTDLPVADANSKEIEYLVVEPTVPYGYTATQTVENTEAQSITNTLKEDSKPFTYTISKKWDDLNDIYKNRPGSLIVKLYQNGNPMQDVTLSNTNWSQSITNLPRVDFQNKKPFVYTIDEPTVPTGYTKGATIYGTKNTTTATSTDTSATIQNNLIKKTSFINKFWLNDSGSQEIKATVQYLDDSKKVIGSQDTLIPTASGYIGIESPRYINKTEVKYFKISENVPTGFRLTTVRTMLEGPPGGPYPDQSDVKDQTISIQWDKLDTQYSEKLMLYNTQLFDLKVTKKWVDFDSSKRKDVTIQLYKDGVYQSGQDKVLTSGNNWIATWTGLEKYEVAAGDDGRFYFANNGKPKGQRLIQYTVKEAPVPDYYTSTVSTPDATLYTNGYTVTNTLNVGYKVVLKKATPNNQLLQGAVFQLSGGNMPAVSATSGSDGTVVFDTRTLTPNTVYTVKEVTAPKGFQVNSTPFTFTVGTDRKVTAVGNSGTSTLGDDPTNKQVVTTVDLKTIQNTLKPFKLTINKQGIFNRNLQGAVFSLKNTTTNTVVNSSLVTDTNGVIAQDGLLVGSYELIETAAPSGYAKLISPIAFTINQDGKVTLTSNPGNAATLNVSLNEGTTNNTLTLTVKNTLKGILPATGGHGKIAYMVGAGIVSLGFLMTAGYYVFRNRKGGSR